MGYLPPPEKGDNHGSLNVPVNNYDYLLYRHLEE